MSYESIEKQSQPHTGLIIGGEGDPLFDAGYLDKPVLPTRRERK